MSIVEAQIHLSRLGYLPGGLDGVWGAKSAAALAEAAREERKLRDLTWSGALPELARLVREERRTVPVLTLDQVRRAFPRFAQSDPYPERWIEALNAAMSWAATSEHRAALFIGQLAHESDGFATLEEYASGAAYEGRRDLGNTEPGDGKRFKGRGPIQLTGRANYRWAGLMLGIPAEQHPEIMGTPALGFLGAALYWTEHNLNALADSGDVTAITRRINGGVNGLTSRGRLTDAAAAMLKRRP